MNIQMLSSTFNYKTVTLTAFAAGWFEVVALPKPMLIFFLFGAMLVDFMTGLLKSWNNGISSSSTGFRKTVSKIGMYVGAILGMWLLANVLGQSYKQKIVDYSILVNGTIVFIAIIEIYSIFENIYEIAPNSFFGKWLAKPIMKFLRGRIENSNPIKEIEDGKQS